MSDEFHANFADSNKEPDLWVLATQQLGREPASLSEYQTALAVANKEVTSVNDKNFKAVGGAAGVAVNEPIQIVNTVIKEVQDNTFLKLTILGVLGFFSYKYFIKGKRK